LITVRPDLGFQIKHEPTSPRRERGAHLRPPRRTLGILCAAVLCGVSAVTGCAGDDTDTATGQGDTAATQTPSIATETATTPVETPTTADETSTGVTTGQAKATFSGGTTGDLEIEVTMPDGSTEYFPIDDDVLDEIWPSGKTAEGVTVTIEEVDGELQVTGLAE
jgi:DnaJ-class molecular chaperone